MQRRGRHVVEGGPSHFVLPPLSYLNAGFVPRPFSFVTGTYSHVIRNRPAFFGILTDLFLVVQMLDDVRMTKCCSHRQMPTSLGLWETPRVEGPAAITLELEDATYHIVVMLYRSACLRL